MTNKSTPVSPSDDTLLEIVWAIVPEKIRFVSPELALTYEDLGYRRVLDGDKEYLIDVWMHRTEIGVFHIHEVVRIAND